MKGFDLVLLSLGDAVRSNKITTACALSLFLPTAFIHLPLYLPITCAVLAVTESFPINSVAMERFLVSVLELLEGLIGLKYLLWSHSELVH